MNDAIFKVLSRLEKRSGLERSHKTDVRADRRMLAITEDTGRLIEIILLAIKARNVLEIGMSVGYSTLWCAAAIKDNSGQIHTIEKSRAKIRRAQKNFAEAGVEKMIKIHNGTALNVLEQLYRKKKFGSFFDFVLIDADKENVIRYFDLAATLVHEGGIIMTDNMLYPVQYRTMMKGLSEHIKEDPRFRTVMCPIGNGEEIAVRI